MISDFNSRFSNAGAIRDLPGSFIYNILPQYKANIVHHIKMLQAAPEVASFVQYHPDEIKKHFKKGIVFNFDTSHLSQ